MTLQNTKLKTCAKNHANIIYDVSDCPACTLLERMDTLLDEREDIDQTNIMELFKELKVVNKRLRKIEKILTPQKEHKPWNFQPMQYARSMAAVLAYKQQKTTPSLDSAELERGLLTSEPEDIAAMG